MHGLSTSMLLLLHSAFMLRVMKLLLKGEVGGCALNSHGNYIVDHGKSWRNHGIMLLNFCGNPESTFGFVSVHFPAGDFNLCQIFSADPSQKKTTRKLQESKFGYRHKRSEHCGQSCAPGFVIKCPVVRSSRRDLI